MLNYNLSGMMGLAMQSKGKRRSKL